MRDKEVSAQLQHLFLIHKTWRRMCIELNADQIYVMVFSRLASV